LQGTEDIRTALIYLSHIGKEALGSQHVVDLEADGTVQILEYFGHLQFVSLLFFDN
jgi:hypothetical protein